MKVKDNLPAAAALIKAKLFKRRTPIIVNWSITYRCNYRCLYCGIWSLSSKEINCKQIFSIIDEMAQMGTKRIHFTGGEPLLRKDIGEILEYCKRKNIKTALNSNGFLVPEKINLLKNLDLLSLSLDGNEEVHDAIRQKGAYQKVMEAVEAARANNLKIRIITVLSKINLDSVDFILDKAAGIGAFVTFQPATKTLMETDSVNPIAASSEEYCKVIKKLISKKKKGYNIGNSISGLKYLSRWPYLTGITCVNGRVICRLEPDGSLYGCGNFKSKSLPLNCTESGFKRAFESLKPVSCKECWCAAMVEMNYLFSLRPDAVLNIIKLTSGF